MPKEESTVNGVNTQYFTQQHTETFQKGREVQKRLVVQIASHIPTEHTAFTFSGLAGHHKEDRPGFFPWQATPRSSFYIDFRKNW